MLSDSFVEVAGVRRSFKSGFELGPIDYTFRPGVTCVLGPNGAGKSTLMRLLIGLEDATEGVIARSGRMGYLPQDFRCPERARLVDYLRYAAWVQDVPRSARDKAVAASLEKVGLSAKRDARSRELSGGMRRRLGIAQAILHDPAIVLLDEPTAGLDLDQRINVARVVHEIGSQCVVVLTTHVLDDVTRMADRVLVLDSGTPSFSGTLAELRQRPRRHSDLAHTDSAALLALEDLMHRGDDD